MKLGTEGSALWAWRSPSAVRDERCRHMVSTQRAVLESMGVNSAELAADVPPGFLHVYLGPVESPTALMIATTI